MASNRVAWGIDVGNRAVKAIRISRDGDDLSIDDIDVIEHATPLSLSGDNRDGLIAAALTELTTRHKIGSIPVGVAVSGQQSFARFIKLPPVEEKKIPEIVRFEAIQQIPFPLDEVEFAWQLFRKPDDPEIEVGIFAMRKELVNHHVSAYTAVNLNVQVVQMSPLAVYNGFCRDQRVQETTLLIDIGSDTTDLVVADGEQIWHRSIPIGGNSFTEVLVRAFRLDHPKAEEMKRDVLSSKYARQIFQAMRPVFADLVAEIQRSMGFYASMRRDSKITRAIGMGGTFKLPGLQKYLQQNLQLEVDLLKGFAATPPTDAKLATLFQDNVLSCATAYGLAIQTLGDAKVTASLLPGHIRRMKMWKDKQKVFVGAAALFLIGAGVSVAGAMLPGLAHAAREEERSRIQSAIAQARELDSQWSTLEAAGETERAVIANVKSLTEDRTLWPQLVSTLRGSLPSTDELTRGGVEGLRQTPRDQRRIVQIESWQADYFGDMGPILGDPRRDRFLTEAPAAAPAAGMDPFMGAGMGLEAEFRGIPEHIRGGIRMGGFPGGFPGGPPMGAPPGDAAGSDIAPVPPEIVAAATGRTGYILRVKGVTPFREVLQLLDETMIANLLQTRIGREGVNVPFYIADAIVVQQASFAERPERLQLLVQAHADMQRLRTGGGADAGVPHMQQWQGPPGRGFPGFVPGGRPPGMPPHVPWPPPGGDPGMHWEFAPPAAAPAPGPAGPDPDAPFRDPLTGEDMRQDMEFSMVVFVVLGNPPVPPPAAPADGMGQPTQP